MFNGIPKPNIITLEFAAKAQYRLLPFIRSQINLQNKVGIVTEDKGGGHYAYQIDDFANKILFEVLEKNNLSCHVFSEEGGWSKKGNNPEYYIICDPYCNTSLTMRSFRESAVAICITDLKGELVSCAIGDLQIDRIFYADKTGAYLWELNDDKDWIKSPMHVSEVQSIDEAFIVTSLLNRKRRTETAKSGFFHRAKNIHGVDGAIMLGRLAAGHVDAYLDPFKGQPLYEVPCCELILKAGGVVSDINGKPFRLSDIVFGLLDNPKARYPLVAASTNNLQKEILDSLNAA